ncbi:MAG: hypothetical protein AB8F74_09325 [Saprospiraceae bacterium]
MNFFKRFFSKKSKAKKELPVPPPPTPQPLPEPKSNFQIAKKAEDNFDRRFRPMTTVDDDKLLHGSVEMIGNYSKLNKEDLPNKTAFNHPENLDHAIKNGYTNWLKSVGMGDGDIAAQLCFALSEYMVKNYEMTLYHDHLPNYKFRVFTLKKMLKDMHISIYPLEFTVQVITEGRSFVEFEQLMIENQKNLPPA